MLNAQKERLTRFEHTASEKTNSLLYYLVLLWQFDIATLFHIKKQMHHVLIRVERIEGSTEGAALLPLLLRKKHPLAHTSWGNGGLECFLHRLFSLTGCFNMLPRSA